MDEAVKRMVERVEWFSPVDYEILDFFDAHDIIINPASLAANIGYEDGYVADRCIVLTNADILQRHPGPKYELSDFGRDLLAGEVDADEIPEPE